MAEHLDFFVNTDLFMTLTCKYADIVLPACSSVERGELKAYQGGYLTFTKQVIAPLYESRSDVDIMCDLARVMDLDDDLLKLPVAVRIARKTLSIVRQNVVFALGVKLLVLVLSALGYANMWAAVFADVGVSVLAILNASRMLKAK